MGEDVLSRLAAHPASAVGQGAPEAQIANAERQLGVRFDQCYRYFLARCGWATLGSSEFFGLGDDVPPYLNLVGIVESERNEAHPPLPPTLIPLKNDGGGNLYCIDAGRSDTGGSPVVFWDHELGAKQQPEAVAPDFAGWLDEQIASAA
jgi:cell wall assembly regulator SMI1